MNAIDMKGSQIVAVTDLGSTACGKIVCWDPSGSVKLEAIANALETVKSSATPPLEVSPSRAVGRALDAVARAHKLEAHAMRRGDWRLVRPMKERADSVQGHVLETPVLATAKIEKGDLVIEASPDSTYEQDIRGAYNEARASLTSSDVSAWLCEKVKGLHGIALRENGGVYFVPGPSVEKWDRLVAAVKLAGAQRIHETPAMRSEQAIEWVVSGVISATEKACADIEAAIPESGNRALTTAEKEARELLDRAAYYEKLLGVKLDALRAQIETTQANIAAAALTLASDSEAS